MEVRQKQKHISLIINNYFLEVHMQGDTAQFEIQNLENLEYFQFVLTPDILQELPMSYAFDEPSEVVKYLSNTKINITHGGVIEFENQLRNGKKKKVTIQTIRKEISQRELLLKHKAIILTQSRIIQKQTTKCTQLQEENQLLKIQIKAIKDTLKIKEVQASQSSFNEHEKTESLSKSTFQIDLNKSDSQQLAINVRKFKKIVENNYYSLIFGRQIAQQSIFSYRVLQIFTKEKLIYYGIGSTELKNTRNCQMIRENGHFVGYQAQSGSIYPKNVKGIASIQNGQIIEVNVNLKAWRISWNSSGIELGSVAIPSKLKGKSIYPVVLVYYLDDEIEFK